MQSKAIWRRLLSQIVLGLGLFIGLTTQLAADSRQPPPLDTDSQSKALVFVEVDEDMLPENVVKVAISQFSYKPAEITVEQGTTILWINEDPAGHNAAFVADNLADREQDLAGPIVGQGEKFAVHFKKAGEYDYYCTPHPFMKGAVIVK